MILKVIKKFNGKAEGKMLNPGDTVVTTDLTRVNALVGRGFCEIASIEDPETEVSAETDAGSAESAANEAKTNGKGKSKKEEE